MRITRTSLTPLIPIVLDSVGNIVNQITYDAFGNVTLESDSSSIASSRRLGCTLCHPT